MRVGDVHTFANLDANDKAQALKPLEEAAEIMEAWKSWQRTPDTSVVIWKRREELEDEIADCMQACANLAAALGIKDMRQAMSRCELRNKQRGRY